MSRLQHAGRALRHRNFKLYFFGQAVSLFGTWMTRLATTWLVYRLTQSALMLGVVGFASQIVSFVLMPYTGAWVEHTAKRRLLIVTQAAAALQSLVMAALTLSHRITLWQIVVLAALQGVINAFDMPARQALIPQMVDDKEDLSNAIAINASVANVGRLLGPAVAGMLIAVIGEGWVFFVDGVSYFAVIASLFLLQLPPHDVVRRVERFGQQVQEGWQYVSRSVSMRSVLILFLVVSMLGYSNLVLLPVFAQRTFHGSAATMGWLTAASGCGSLLSALMLVVRKNAAGLMRSMAISGVAMSVALVLFGASRTFWISLLLMAVAGFGIMQVAAASNTVLQALVEDKLRARVMSYYAMAFYGGAPFGSLLAGVLAHGFGAPHAVMMTGVCCLLGSIWFALQLRHLRVAVAALSTY